MTIDAAPNPPTHQPWPSRGPLDRHGRHRVVGWLLLAAWVAVMASVLVLGTRESTYADLRADLASGGVDRVEVIGERLRPDSRGYVVREVRWRDDLVLRTARVGEASSLRHQQRARRGNDLDVVLLGTVEDHLQELDPDVSVVAVERPSDTWTLVGTTVPGSVALAWLALVVACLFVVDRARTWRATPWAWAWLMLLVPPYGVLAFLVLGGPTGLFRPRDPHRVWLPGGWAFLLALLVGGATNGT